MAPIVTRQYLLVPSGRGRGRGGSIEIFDVVVRVVLLLALAFHHDLLTIFKMSLLLLLFSYDSYSLQLTEKTIKNNNLKACECLSLISAPQTHARYLVLITGTYYYCWCIYLL